MPILTHLNIENFRNLTTSSHHFSPRFNLFYGDNGSGKTSFLEAIYYLCLGKSFRTAHTPCIIHHHAEQFRVVAQTMAESHDLIGIERKKTGERCVKLNGEFQTSMVAITRKMPIQFMSPMSYRFFHDGPKLRRQYLDWALFHVEPCFLKAWQQFQHVLRQRNSAIKQHQHVRAWDAEFIDSAIRLDRMRSSIFEQIEPLCQGQLSRLLPHVNFSFRYHRGWPMDTNLASLLRESALRDQQLKYTFYGPQRADFQLICRTTPVQDALSQGQQKLAAYALHLSLGTLLQKISGTSPIYLIDDLPSELDGQSQRRITNTLQQLEAQVFITGIAQGDLEPLFSLSNTKLFHVEHGDIRECAHQDLLSSA